MKVLFYVDTGGSTGGPGMHSVLIYRAFRRLHPETTGPFSFAADPDDEAIFAKALGSEVLAPLASRTLDDPSADPVVPRRDFYRELCALARRHGCDHIHILWGFLHPSQIEAVPPGERLPVSVTLCDATGRGEDEDIDAMYFGSERWERYLREALSVRCEYLSISDKTRRDALKKGVPESAVETVHLWVSSELATRRSDAVDDYVAPATSCPSTSSPRARCPRPLMLRRLGAVHRRALEPCCRTPASIRASTSLAAITSGSTCPPTASWFTRRACATRSRRTPRSSASRSRRCSP